MDSVAFAAQQAAKNRKRSEFNPEPIQDRSMEPSTAIVDGLYCFEYLVSENVMGKKPGEKSPGWFNSFFTFFKKPIIRVPRTIYESDEDEDLQRRPR